MTWIINKGHSGLCDYCRRFRITGLLSGTGACEKDKCYTLKSVFYYPETCIDYKPSGISMLYMLESKLQRVKYKFLEWGWQFWTLEEKLQKGRIPFQIQFAPKFQHQMEDMIVENEVNFQMEEDGEINAFNIENTQMDDFHSHFAKLNHLAQLAQKYQDRSRKSKKNIKKCRKQWIFTEKL